MHKFFKTTFFFKISTPIPSSISLYPELKKKKTLAFNFTHVHFIICIEVYWECINE